MVTPKIKFKYDLSSVNLCGLRLTVDRIKLIIRVSTNGNILKTFFEQQKHLFLIQTTETEYFGKNLWNKCMLARKMYTNRNLPPVHQFLVKPTLDRQVFPLRHLICHLDVIPGYTVSVFVCELKQQTHIRDTHFIFNVDSFCMLIH